MGIFDFLKWKQKNKQKEELTFEMLLSYNNCNPNDYKCLLMKDMIVGKKGLMLFDNRAILRYSNGAILSMIEVQSGKIIKVTICDDNQFNDKNLVENFSAPVSLKFETQRKNINKIVEEIQLRIKNQGDLYQNKVLNKLKEEEQRAEEIDNISTDVKNKNGLNIHYADDGCRHEWYNKDGVHNGDYKIFNKNGILISLNDLFPAPEKKHALIVNGKQKEWYDDGSPKLHITFIMGKRDGFGVTYDEECRIDKISYYKDDVDVSWDSNENKKLVLREIKKYMEDGVKVYPVQYLGLCETSGYSGNWGEEDHLQIITNVLDDMY